MVLQTPDLPSQNQSSPKVFTLTKIRETSIFLPNSPTSLSCLQHSTLLKRRVHDDFVSIKHFFTSSRSVLVQAASAQLSTHAGPSNRQPRSKAVESQGWFPPQQLSWPQAIKAHAACEPSNPKPPTAALAKGPHSLHGWQGDWSPTHGRQPPKRRLQCETQQRAAPTHL